MIEVYHNLDVMNFKTKLLMNEKIEDISAGLLIKVAHVETSSLEQAYCLTSNIEKSWVENNEVVSFINKAQTRSTDMGDVFIREEIAYMVLESGFKRVTIIE